MNFKSCIRASVLFTALAAGAADRPEPLSGAASGDRARSVTIPTGYWQGDLVAPGRSWKIALDVDSSRDMVLLDMPSIWRIGLPLESFEQRGDSLFFDLPWDMGRVHARIGGGRIVGVAMLNNGDTGVLRLQQSTVGPTHSRDLDFRSDSITIGATVFMPTSAGPHPAAVILHGGGDSSRESPPYRFWGPYLARRGYAVLLYDKRGSGESGGDWRTVGFEERAADVLAGIGELRRLAEVDTGKIGLIGVSQGSWVAGLVARDDPGVRFVVNISGPAVSVREADTAALRFELQRDGWGPKDVGERLALWQMMVDYTTSDSDDRLWGKLVAAEVWAGERAWSAGDGAFRIGERGSWWKQWYGRVADYDPLPVLTDSDVPMLWMYGERDSESDVARNVAVLEQLRLEAGKDYSIAVFPAAGHGLLVPVSERGLDLEPLTAAPGFFDMLLHWMGSQTAD